MRSVDRIVSENYHHICKPSSCKQKRKVVVHFKALQTHAQTFGRYKKGANTSYLIMFTHSFHFVSVMSIFCFESFPRKKSHVACWKKTFKILGKDPFRTPTPKKRDLERPCKDSCLEKKYHPGGCAMSFRLSRKKRTGFQHNWPPIYPQCELGFA